MAPIGALFILLISNILRYKHSFDTIHTSPSRVNLTWVPSNIVRENLVCVEQNVYCKHFLQVLKKGIISTAWNILLKIEPKKLVIKIMQRKTLTGWGWEGETNCNLYCRWLTCYFNIIFCWNWTCFPYLKYGTYPYSLTTKIPSHTHTHPSAVHCSPHCFWSTSVNSLFHCSGGPIQVQEQGNMLLIIDLTKLCVSSY